MSSIMEKITLSGHTFITDGSRLLHEDEQRAHTALKDMSASDVFLLSQFIRDNMQWMNVEYTVVDISSVNESCFSIFHTLRNGEDVNEDAFKDIPVYVDYDCPESVNDISFPVEFLCAVCDIYQASAPYVWLHSKDISTDCFYTRELLPYPALTARNYKEFVSAMLGGYCKNFPVVSIYDMCNYHHAFHGSDTPIETISTIVTYVDKSSREMHFHTDYLPFALKDKHIGLTPARLVNWFNNYPMEEVCSTIGALIEVSDSPFTNTVSARGNMRSIKRRCDDAISKGMRAFYEEANEHICNLDREPDDVFHNHAIYALRSAIELTHIGQSLEICVGNEVYRNGVENGNMNLFLIEGDDRQYVAHIQNKEIVELRGWSNHKPVSKDVRDVANYCLGKAGA